MTDVRIGIVGGGINSAVGRAHMSALELIPTAKVVAGTFSRDPVVNQASGEWWGVAPELIFAGPEALFAQGMIDVVVILSPTSQHAEQLTAAARSGLSVICEKALTTNLSSATIVSEEWSTRVAELSVVYNYTGYPMVRELRAMIMDGQLGKLHRMELKMPQEGFTKVGSDGEPVTPQDWRLVDDAIPTVSLDLGVHLHSLAHVLAGGRASRVAALQRSSGHFRSVVDTVEALVEHDDGMVATYSFGKTSLGNRNGLAVSVFGDQGSAIWVQESPDQLLYSDARGRRTIIDRGSPDLLVAGARRYMRFKAGHPTGFVEALANYYEDIFDSNQTSGRRDSVLGLDVALEGLQLMDAFARSDKAQAWVRV